MSMAPQIFERVVWVPRVGSDAEVPKAHRLGWHPATVCVEREKCPGGRDLHITNGHTVFYFKRLVSGAGRNTVQV